MNLSRALFRALLGRRLPVTSGMVRVAGVRGRVRIDRDQWGIPHIEAQNDHDAWFALGFCQGQDRTFQLETILRVSRGTVAEMVGVKGLPIDRVARRVGFARAAARQLPVLADDIRADVEAFAAGVTAGANVGWRKKPHEFALLGGTPTPWTAADVLGFVILQSFALPSNWDAELARLQILLKDGPEALHVLDPSAGPARVEGLADLDVLAADLEAFREFWPAGGGSNNWAIGPGRTAAGRPVVCNDPHLFPAMPIQWYLAHIRTPDWAIAGATFAGSPGFAAGFNGHVAWAVTAGLTDNADLFLEHLGPDGRSVKQGDKFIECRVHEEIIRVKGGQSVTETILETPRGPVVSPALGGDWPALSLRAVYLDPLPVRGFLAAQRARCGAELRRCFEQWPALPLNLTYADTGGNIGWQLVGQAPRRKKGNGTIPMPGWDEACGWHPDLIPFDQMPHVENPADGFFATANNPPVGHEKGPFLGVEWLDPYRVNAIREALGAADGWTVADCQKLQTDYRSMPWREIRDVVLDAIDEREALRRVNARSSTEGTPGAHATRLADMFAILRDWDGRVSPDSAAAAVYELFVAEMIVKVTHAKAPKGGEWLLGTAACTPGINLFYLRRVGHLCRLLNEQPPGWFADGWPAVIRETVRSAWSRAAGKTWGELHPLRLKHMLFGDMPFLQSVFNSEAIPYGGDADTICQGAVRPLKPIDFTDNIAGMRMAVDVGDWSNSRFVLAGGQSGNPLSPHHTDLFELWQRGDGVPMAWAPEEVRAATAATLELISS